MAEVSTNLGGDGKAPVSFQASFAEETGTGVSLPLVPITGGYWQGLCGGHPAADSGPGAQVCQVFL